MGLLLEAFGEMDKAYALLPFAMLHPEHCLFFVCVFVFARLAAFFFTVLTLIVVGI